MSIVRRLRILDCVQREFVKKLLCCPLNIHTVPLAAKPYNYCGVSGMQFIQGTNRHQSYFATLEDRVSPDNPVRLMDAFVDKLELQKLAFTNTVHKSEGRPPYAPGVLLQLYLYGYLHKIRSSRKLEKECSRNTELQWLLQNLPPNYPTTSRLSQSASPALAGPVPLICAVPG